MVITTPSDDILYTEGGGLFSFQASSAISGGAVVCVAGPMSVKTATVASSQGLVGVASYRTAAGDMVTVYGPGNIVRCCASGNFAAGARLVPVATGKVDEYDKQTGGSYDWERIGVALDASTGNLSAVRILVK